MKTRSKPNIYKQAQRFADVTKTFISKGNVSRAKKCLQIAEYNFVNGTSQIKNIISNQKIQNGQKDLERLKIKNTQNLTAPKMLDVS